MAANSYVGKKHVVEQPVLHIRCINGAQSSSARLACAAHSPAVYRPSHADITEMMNEYLAQYQIAHSCQKPCHNEGDQNAQHNIKEFHRFGAFQKVSNIASGHGCMQATQNDNSDCWCMQDIMRLDNTARMNFPGTTTNNWGWRVGETNIWGKLKKQAAEIKGWLEDYDRTAEINPPA